MASKRRVGLLTSGGDCPGLNAVIRAVVKCGVTELGFDIVGIKNSFNGLLSTPYDVVNLTRDVVRGIISKGGTILGTTNRGNPFAFPMKDHTGAVAMVDRSAEIIESLRILELEGLIVVGGDGSLQIAKRFMDMGVRVIAVPKTIDNDIAATDFTFGFHTAVEVATEAIDRLHSTAESHDRVMVIEVMGRDAGWIAMHSGISGGADVVLIPEIPFDIQRICDKVKRRQTAGRRFSIVVVAEGAKARGDRPIYLEEKNPGGMPRLGGVGNMVAAGISQRTGIETRVTVLGHLLRGGTPSSFDRLLGTRFGIVAMELAQQRRWGEMVALRGTSVVAVNVDECVGKQKLIDPRGELVAAARQLGIEVGAEPDAPSAVE